MSAKSGKSVVVNRREDSRVPFLRGILTRSLQEAGLPFEEAYDVASKVRSDLNRVEEIDSDGLRELVARRLEKRGLSEVLARYTRPAEDRVTIEVSETSGDVTPFSKGRLGQSLEICALPRDQVYAVAAQVEADLLRSEKYAVSTEQLGRLTARTLEEMVGGDASARYVRWVHMSRSGVPIVLLVGGTTGCGKSTLSATLANRLGIVRTQSTDMLREVMRLLVPAQLVPALHASSFGAYRSLPRWRIEDDRQAEPHMLDGYLLQSGEVGIAVDGVFRRAVREQVSLILEGVHINPALQRRFGRRRDVVVVPFVLASLKRKMLRRQLIGRGQQVTGRRAERYLDHFDEIWQLQTYLLSEADRYRIPIIQNVTMEEAVRQVMSVVSHALTKRFSSDPDEIFGAES